MDFARESALRRIATAQKVRAILYSEPAKEAALDRVGWHAFGVN
jgi:hypothetical protein